MLQTLAPASAWWEAFVPASFLLLGVRVVLTLAVVAVVKTFFESVLWQPRQPSWRAPCLESA